MSKHGHMPSVPPANRSPKGTGNNAAKTNETAKPHAVVNILEQGDTANIKQNTTNEGFFKGPPGQMTNSYAGASH